VSNREHNGRGSRGCQRGNISDVGMLLVLISLLSLAFASMFTVLPLGLAIRTLLLLVLLLLLAGPLLVASVWVTMLALYHADLVGIVLPRPLAHRVLLHSRLGTRWSDVDVMKSLKGLKAGIGEWRVCRE
jgi:hypothetical protein